MRRNKIFVTSLWFALILLFLLLPVVADNPYLLRILAIAFMNVVLAVTFWLVLRAGPLNMAHIGFNAIGAYLSAALVMHKGWSFWLSAPVAAGVAGLCSAAVGPILLRLRGPYFFLVSFAMLEVIRLFFHNAFPATFGGAAGLVGIPVPDGITSIGLTPVTGFYVFTLVLAIITVAGTARLMSSQFGVVLSAVRQSQDLTAAIGIDGNAYKLTALSISAIISAFTGAVFAHFNGVVHADDFGLNRAVIVVLHTVVGGTGHIAGPVLGAFVFTLISEQLRQLQSLQLLGFGIVLIVVLIAAPRGLLGLIEWIRQRWSTKASWRSQTVGTAQDN